MFVIPLSNVGITTPFKLKNMELGTEKEFIPGRTFAGSGQMYKSIPAIIKEKGTMMCTKCHRYRVIHLNFNEVGDHCRYCRKKQTA